MKDEGTILNSDFYVNPLGPFWSRDVFNLMRHLKPSGSDNLRHRKNETDCSSPHYVNAHKTMVPHHHQMQADADDENSPHDHSEKSLLVRSEFVR